MVKLVQEPNSPKSEKELIDILDQLYLKSQQCLEQGVKPKFKGLLEIIKAEATILTAIHKIKSNKGSKTPGSDDKTIRDILEKEYDTVIELVREGLENYKPLPVRRVWIEKPGKKEKRPLGIPTIVDRIIQECVRTVIEPIMEAQFIKHSYGFRPMRSAHQAMERLNNVLHTTGHHWVVEGDISKFFDNVNHRVLIKKLHNLGIHDKRVLMIIKSMLEAGIMGELDKNNIGTPQGGIISPLLANAYLDSFDKWVVREWESKKTKHEYGRNSEMYKALRKRSNLNPAYLIRYADDWVIVTDSKKNAEKIKYKAEKYLEKSLKISLSKEKTLITNVTKKPVKFLGFTIKLEPGKARKGYVTICKPDPGNLSRKVEEIKKTIDTIVFTETTEQVIDKINQVNTMIRGVISYYSYASHVNLAVRKHDYGLKWYAYGKLKKRFRRGKTVNWVPANQTANLREEHKEYTTAIPAIQYNDLWIGITHLGFAKWDKSKNKVKNPKETPYTKEGREIRKKLTDKKPVSARADELLSLHLSNMIAMGNANKLYNFEYFLNRAYAFNRDKGQCKICKCRLDATNVNIHHNKPKLPLDIVNKVMNLSSLCKACHGMIHDGNDYSQLEKKIWNKIIKYRNMLTETE
ncbi:group II intron reverse transcriptase/maturase [Bacillus cereus]|uniref:group II intron reverse transcriptase/maturase n=1 Tax=Bacillus cereus TaxID=1396 RepID=UPI003D65C021